MMLLPVRDTLWTVERNAPSFRIDLILFLFKQVVALNLKESLGQGGGIKPKPNTTSKALLRPWKVFLPSELS